VKIKSHYTLALLVGLLLLPVMISNESFWMDECGTAAYGWEPTLSAWWQHLSHDAGADCQLPLGLFFTWVVSHTFGSHEWQLRAMNVLWGALALLAMYRAGKRLQLPWLPLLLAIQPYFWFYTDEARPYALELACGAWLFAGLTAFLCSRGEDDSWAWEFSIGAVALCYTTMLAPVAIATTLFAGGIFALKNKWKIHRKSIFVLVGSAVAVLPVGIYYGSSLGRAAGAMLWHVDLKFFAYVIYEVTGLVGLGPNIDSIRELARSPHLAATIMNHGSQFALAAVCAVVLVLVLFLGLRKWSAQSKSSLLGSLVLVLITSSLLFVVVGIAIQKAFWGRHFAPLVPFYVVLLGVAIAGLQGSRKLRWLTFMLAGLLVFSSLNLRFGAEHRKENYREAAAIARSALAEKKSVWWAAAYYGARYYHLDCATSSPESGKAFCTFFTDFTKYPPPDMIIFSRPDVFDVTGALQKIIRDNGYRPIKTLDGFVIWSK
jgi:predicted membrane protein